MSATIEDRRRKVEKWTLKTAFLNFWRYPSPCILAVGVLATWSVRIYLGAWTIWEPIMAVAVLAAWPLVEWLIHVFILHRKPTTWAGRTIDLHLSQKHRAHHRDPNHMPTVLIPPRSLLMVLPVVAVLAWLIMPDLAKTFSILAIFFIMALIYEWCHYLIHTNYRPKSALYKHLWRHHRLHHFKNENYWFGVSMTGGDRLLRTAPDFREVETSDTCRTLGVDEEVLEESKA